MLLGSDKPEIRDILRVFYRGASYFLEFFPSVAALLRQDHINYSHESSQEEIAVSTDESRQILTVILPENHREISSPERLIKALDSIQLFYNVFAKLEDVDSSELSIAAIDSGSDKSFDFLGAAQLMSSVKELIIELWDRIVFYRERKLHEKLDLVAKSLPILERINALEKEDKMGKEQCELLRRAIIDGANKFISSGAIIPEFQKNNYHNPRELMAPEAKLLVESNSVVEKEKIVKKDDSSFEDELDEGDDLSEQEKELLKKINLKSKKNKKE